MGKLKHISNFSVQRNCVDRHSHHSEAYKEQNQKSEHTPVVYSNNRYSRSFYGSSSGAIQYAVMGAPGSSTTRPTNRSQLARIPISRWHFRAHSRMLLRLWTNSNLPHLANPSLHLSFLGLRKRIHCFLLDIRFGKTIYRIWLSNGDVYCFRQVLLWLALPLRLIHGPLNANSQSFRKKTLESL